MFGSDYTVIMRTVAIRRDWFYPAAPVELVPPLGDSITDT